MTTADFATAYFAPGPFTVIVAKDAVLASGWTAETSALLDVVHPTLHPTELRQRSDVGEISKAIARYHEGDVTVIDDIPVRQRGGDFITAAWAALRKVPSGQPVSYTELAALAGRPVAVRAAASACARNAAALFVPCHRVVRIGGGLGGFRWGTEVKNWLLTHESHHS